MKTMPWYTRVTDWTERLNTGHPVRWDCAVDDCTHGGTALTDKEAERAAARHSVSHTDEELTSTGYQVRFNYAAAAKAAGF